MLTAIIMASGLSQRMGENKLLLPYKGRPLFQHVLEAVVPSQVDHTIVITAYSEIFNYCHIHNISCYYNDAPEKGQGRSIKLGIGHSKSDSDYMFFVADQPLITTETIDQIISFYLTHPGCIIIPEYKNTPANPRIFPNKLREDFLVLGEDVRGNSIIEQHKNLVQFVSMEDPLSFLDIDTQEEYGNLLNHTNI